MNFVSYAQNFEDVVLWRALGDIVAGCYLDIGAQDPVFDSVSLAFYEAGWRGIHVEPTPAYAARLREARPDEVVIEAAVSDAPGPLELHEFCGTGLSTGKSEIATRHAERGFSGQKIIVPCVRLDKLFETAGDIHWMKIDVEGMESEVLASWGKSGSRPWVVVVEATAPMEQSPTDHLWRHEVERRGYSEVYFDGLSRYFLHEDHAELTERFAAPPNIFDGFQVSSRHFSTQLFAQDAGNEIAEASRRAEQLQAELSTTDDQLATASAEADQAQAEHAAAKERALALEQQLAALSAETDVARAERVGAIEALAKAREEYSVALDQAWRERHAFEIGLREQWSAKEQELKQADAARDAELRDAGMRAAALDERASRQGIEIEQLANAKDALERRIAAFSKEIAELHLSYRSAAGDDQKRAQTERDRLFQELAQREAELSAAKAMIDQLTSDMTRLRNDAAGERRQLELAITQSETRAKAIEALIHAALARPPGTWQRLGRALGFAREDGARQALSSWRPVQAEPVHQSLESTMQMTAAEATRDPCLPAYSLEELIALHDVDFVRCAYVTLLGRQSDAQGEAYYTDRIRRGHSRMSVLSQLRRSDEARSHDPGIRGLDAALAKAARARLPIVGALLPESSIEPQRDHWKPFRALANQLNLIDDRLTVSLLRQAESSRDIKRLSASAPDEASPTREFSAQKAPATIEQILATFGSHADA